MQNKQLAIEQEINSQGIIIVERNIKSSEIKGIYYQDTKYKFIIINKNIPTYTERTCILAEELGHYYTGAGNLILYGYDTPVAQKQERAARIWAYKKLAPPDQVYQACLSGMVCIYDYSEYFGVTEWFMNSAIEYYFKAGLLMPDIESTCG